VYDLPREILDTIQLKDDYEAPAELETPSTPQPSAQDEPSSIDSSTSKPGITCTLCGLSFANVQEQRSHARSDIHGYNMKQRLRGQKAVNETEFEKLVGDLDESISGSDSESDSESEEDDASKTSKTTGSNLSALLKRQANIEEPEEAETYGKKRKRGAGKAPVIWFKTPHLPSNTSLGIYRALFSQVEQQRLPEIVEAIHKKQLSSAPPPAPAKTDDDDGGVPLPKTEVLGPHIFLCMIGGGHFAAMIVSLKPKVTKVHGNTERQATVIAHKTFHRYTTRRKQGGAQSAADNAKGGIHSAGSSLRRANEIALETDIHQLLIDWKSMIDTSELLFIRASGTTNRRVLFGPYDGQVLRSDDPRNRGFPFSSRRATQAELIRCFTELTRVKVSVIDEAALAAAAAEAEAEAQRATAAAATKAQAAAAKSAKTERSAEEEAALLHTTQIEALIRRSKAPALLSYLSTNSLSADFEFYPPFSQAHHHASSPLHLAASINSPAIVTALLLKAKADPSHLNGDAKPAIDLAGDRATRDAFRLCRSELGESAWDWAAAHVPDPLTRAAVEERDAHEKEEAASAEAERRKVELERIKEEDKRKKDARKAAGVDRIERKHGKGKAVSASVTAEDRREQEARGMTPEMQMRLEREKRAKAAEERMKKLKG
jgi:hypothetical protein